MTDNKKCYIQGVIDALIHTHSGHPPLSEREKTCVFLKKNGKSQKNIGLILGISRSSVQVYLRRAYKKIQKFIESIQNLSPQSPIYIKSSTNDKQTRGNEETQFAYAEDLSRGNEIKSAEFITAKGYNITHSPRQPTKTQLINSDAYTSEKNQRRRIL